MCPLTWTNIEYGYSIPEVSKAVQERVKNAIETMTGLTVSEVNIRIADVTWKTINSCRLKTTDCLHRGGRQSFFY